MATATIRIDQAAHPTQPAGVSGRAREDLVLDEVVTLRSITNSGVTSWRWALLDRPNGSAAALSNPTISVCTFTPDVEGTYLVRLQVNDGREGESATTVVVVRDADGLRIPAAGEDLEANWLTGAGVPNTRGWHPDLAAWLLAIQNGRLVYDIDFSVLPSAAITNGPVTIGDREWQAVNVDDYADSADVVLSNGVVIVHRLGNITEIAGNDLAPRIAIALGDLVEGYDPTARYFFLVQYSWAPEPDATGERFSMGLYAPIDEPHLGCALRFAGATARYSSTDDGDMVTHEAERANLATASMAIETAVLAFSIDSPTSISVWQTDAAVTTMPSTYRGLNPVASQRLDDPTAPGDPDVFAHPDVLFVLALASTGNAAEHGVVISRLSVWRAMR